MADWARDTPWRQGHLLTADAIRALGLADTNTPAAVAVISHDCDLAQDPKTEPDVEVIVGRIVEKPDGNYTHAKNLRKLHLRYVCEGQPMVVELQANGKQLVSKDGEAGLAGYRPLAGASLGSDEKGILQLWLAARYRRAAFPDEFDRRMGKETGLREQLAKILKVRGEHVAAVFFDVDSGEEVQRHGADDTYTLSITLLYSTAVDPGAAEREAQAAQAAIERVFKDCCHVGSGRWRWIELRECEAMADTAMTYAQSVSFKKWQADHISLHSDRPQEMLNE